MRGPDKSILCACEMASPTIEQISGRRGGGIGYEKGTGAETVTGGRAGADADAGG